MTHRLTIHADSLLTTLDPRGRLLAALAFAIVVAVTRQPLVLAAAALIVAALLAVAQLPWHALRPRLITINALALALLILMPLSATGAAFAHLGPIALSQRGLEHALLITARMNLIVLAYTALVSTVPPVALGHAMLHLYLPRKLVVLYFFTVRYLDEFGDELSRLRFAMRARGFRPHFSMHTWRALGHLLTMLLVRSFTRAERVMDAMKCRGWNGQFPLLDHFHWRRRDTLFSLAAVCVILVLASLAWSHA